MKPTFFGRKAPWGLALGLSLAFAAQADAVYTWNYVGTDANGAGVAAASAGAPALVTTGGFVTNLGSSGATGNWSDNTSGNPSAALTFQAAQGLGMGTDATSTPNGAIDNNGTYTEGLLLSFSTTTKLTGIDLGLVFGDADISVFRFAGSTAPSLNGLASTLSDMSAAGWQLVGNYANLTSDSTSPYAYNRVNGATDADGTAGAGSAGSNWWLITAYNTNFGTGAGLTQDDDYFKLLSVAGVAADAPSNNVPEPTSLALVSLALCGVAYARRRQPTRQN